MTRQPISLENLRAALAALETADQAVEKVDRKVMSESQQEDVLDGIDQAATIVRNCLSKLEQDALSNWVPTR